MHILSKLIGLHPLTKLWIFSIAGMDIGFACWLFDSERGLAINITTSLVYVTYAYVALCVLEVFRSPRQTISEMLNIMAFPIFLLTWTLLMQLGSDMYAATHSQNFLQWQYLSRQVYLSELLISFIGLSLALLFVHREREKTKFEIGSEFLEI